MWGFDVLDSEYTLLPRVDSEWLLQLAEAFCSVWRVRRRRVGGGLNRLITVLETGCDGEMAFSFFFCFEFADGEVVADFGIGIFVLVGGERVDVFGFGVVAFGRGVLLEV